MAKKWYVVHTYSGYENRVKSTLEEKIKTSGKEGLFGEILVPTEKVVDMVKGVKRTTSRKFFPGYILINMELNDETWHMVKNTPKVTGFVGGQEAPPAVSDEEVRKIARQMEEGAVRPKPKVLFSRGENIRVIDGPFTNFAGIVEEVKPDKGKLKILVSIFSRATSVELEFGQVEKT
ncbi:MAG: transcription termination/antitermination protein NusG [Deltaproteobacteria bacterium]|nr:transcription termination/antitermination protein NusG [Deltaproteobacteria bacterium]